MDRVPGIGHPKEKRNIRADEKLLALFDGKKVVSMFEMTKLVNGHLVCWMAYGSASGGLVRQWVSLQAWVK
jgi:SWIB/MDM2 domain